MNLFSIEILISKQRVPCANTEYPRALLTKIANHFITVSVHLAKINPSEKMIDHLPNDTNGAKQDLFMSKDKNEITSNLK